MSKLRWAYVVLGAIIMMCLGSVYSWSVFRLPVEKFFDVGVTLSGLPYMTVLAFYAGFVFLTGRFMDKYSPRIIIFAGTALLAIGWILSAFAPNIFILTITYGMIGGAGIGIVYGTPIAVAAKWFPEKKGLAVGLVLVGFGLSPLVTAPLARNIIESFGIMQSFLILGIAFGIILPILSFPLKNPSKSDIAMHEEIHGTTDCTNDLNTAQMLKTRNFRALYGNFMIGAMIGLMLIGMTSNVGIGMIKLSPISVTLYMAVFAISNGIGRPVFGWLTDKLSPKKAMLISYCLIIVAALLMLIAREGSAALFVVAFSLFWFNLGGWMAIAPTSTHDMFGTKYYSQNFGVVFTAYSVGAIIGVFASGLLMDILQNYSYLFYSVIALCLIGIFLSKRIHKN